MNRLRDDPRVTMFLLPLPVLAKDSKGTPVNTSSPSTSVPKAAAKVQPKKKFRATKKAERSKPDALATMETVTKDGQNVCWSYNLESGCQGPLIQGSKIPKCAKGLHVCAYCHKPNHSQMVCNQKKRGSN